MSKPTRLDAELVRRGFTASRTEAKRAIETGLVAVNGLKVEKASSLVRGDATITLLAPAARFVSRGGEKLDSALENFDVPVAGRRWLDAGASTGGFTDRLLKGGAAAVAAVDVGYGQLDWRLRNDDRVVVFERTNVRYLERDELPWPPDGIVADLSFISLRVVLPALVEVATEAADYVLLVKPQFEAGREAVGKGGVVSDPGEWRIALERVSATASEQGLGLVAACASPLTGPAGNHEFFVHLRRDAVPDKSAIDKAIDKAIEEAGRTGQR